MSLLLTTVPLLATLAPAVRTLARTTLPKLPSPISLRTSNLSSKASVLEPTVDPLWVKSWATVMMSCAEGEIQFQIAWECRQRVGTLVKLFPGELTAVDGACRLNTGYSAAKNDAER